MQFEASWIAWLGLVAMATLPALAVSMVFLRVTLRLIRMVGEQQVAVLALSDKPSAQQIAGALERKSRLESATENGQPQPSERRAMRPIA